MEQGAEPRAPRVVFFAPQSLTPLDLFGPLQAFELAGYLAGHQYHFEVCALTESLPVIGNLHISRLIPFEQVELISQGNMTVMFRFGTCPTGIRVTSFSATTSTTDTELEPAFAT
jgi:hypothetical protein